MNFNLLLKGKSGLDPPPCGDHHELVLSPYGYGLCQQREDTVNVEASQSYKPRVKIRKCIRTQGEGVII